MYWINVQFLDFFYSLKFQFYCATIAYHMGLNANLGGLRTPANDQEKWTFGFGRVHGLVCTIAVSFGNSSFFSRWPPSFKAFEINLQYFTVFLKIYLSLNTETTSVSLFGYIESYFCDNSQNR